MRKIISLLSYENKGTLKTKTRKKKFSLKAVQYPACCRWRCSHLALTRFVDGWQEKMALEILQRIHNTYKSTSLLPNTSKASKNLIWYSNWDENFIFMHNIEMTALTISSNHCSQNCASYTNGPSLITGLVYLFMHDMHASISNCSFNTMHQLFPFLSNYKPIHKFSEAC